MQDRSLSLVVIISAAASVASPGLSWGASFDCAKASAGREQLICQNPKLSELDAKLGQLYRERISVLSAQGAELLLNSQRRWLHYAAKVCPLTEPKTQFWSPESCFEERYRDRIAELDDAGKRIGPYIFNRVDFYAAEPAPDRDSGWAAGFFTRHVGYPQIDAPLTPAAIAWNKQAEKKLAAENDCGLGDDETMGDNETMYKIGYATHSVISVYRSYGIYCHGQAHPHYTLGVDNTVMAPSFRKLTMHDVFGASSNWSARLRGLFDAALRKADWPGSGDDKEGMRAELEDNMMHPEDWLFTQDGLEVEFDEEAGGCYACTPQPVRIPWADLKPLMGSGALLP